MVSHYATMALRSFARSPFTTCVNVLALALGLTAFVIAYAVESYWDRSERHFENADRTYVITADLAARDGSIRTGTQPTTNRIYADYLKTDFPEFEAVARASIMNAETGVASDDLYTRMFVVVVDPEFLDIFDLPFVSGDARDALRRPNSVVLTAEAATRLFGDADPIGHTVTLANVLDVTVTGVVAQVPEPSHLGRSASATLRFDVLASWDTQENLQAAVNEQNASEGGDGGEAAGDNGGEAAGDDGGNTADRPPPPENWLGGYCCTTYVMLSRDADLTAAALNARLKDFGERRVPPEQAALASLEIGAVPITELMVAQLNGQLFGAAASVVSITALLLLLGGLVLAVACINYANLATAQAARRAREVGLRKALGAGKRKIMLQYLFEAALLTIGALVVALIGIRLLAPVLRNSTGIDLGLALFDGFGFGAFLAGLLAAVTVLGGSYPAFVLSRVHPIEALRIGRTRIGPKFAATLLVGVQFAAASFLLIAVIVMYSQNSELKRTGLGSTADPFLIVANFAQYSGVETELLRSELLRLPQVTGLTSVGQPPWSLGANLMMFGRAPDESAALVTAYQNTVGYDFFSTLGFEMLAGRAFDREHGEDLNAQGMFDAQRTVNVVVDAALARELGFAAPEDAADALVYFPERITRAFGAPAQPVRIIGVVANKPLHFTGAGATANFYTLGTDLGYQVVRLSASDVGGGVAAVDALWKRLSPDVSINRDFMDELFNQSYENFARINQVFAGLAVVAFSISVIGLFGMAVQVAGRRVHEIGVRKSLGARKRQILAMLLKDFSKPVVVANVVAWPLGYIAAQAYLSVFIQRIPLTPLPFLASLAITVLIAWAAVGGQALRAAMVSPSRVLRFE